MHPSSNSIPSRRRDSRGTLQPSSSSSSSCPTFLCERSRPRTISPRPPSSSLTVRDIVCGGSHRQAGCAGRPAPRERRRCGRGDARRRLRREHRNRRCVLARIRARARRDSHSARRRHRRHPRRRRVAQPGLAGDDPRGRPLRNRARARRVRQRHRARWRRRRHRVAVRAPARRAHRRAEPRAGDDPGRRVAEAADAAARSGHRPAPRLPDSPSVATRCA